jgi:hypothetical protein
MSKARDLANAGTALTTVSATELGYLDGVTSAVQTQVDAKIAKSLVTAKGDLIVATGSGTVVAQPVGTDGQYLQADSAQADGVKWATVSSGITRNIQVFTSSQTWTVPSTAKYVDVLVVGGGCGGRGGCRNTDNNDNGGNGGAVTIMRDIYLNGTGTVSVVVGAGSSGTTGSATSTQATAPSAAGYSGFGSYVYSQGGTSSAGGLAGYKGVSTSTTKTNSSLSTTQSDFAPAMSFVYGQGYNYLDTTFSTGAYAVYIGLNSYGLRGGTARLGGDGTAGQNACGTHPGSTANGTSTSLITTNTIPQDNWSNVQASLGTATAGTAGTGGGAGGAAGVVGVGGGGGGCTTTLGGAAGQGGAGAGGGGSRPNPVGGTGGNGGNAGTNTGAGGGNGAHSGSASAGTGGNGGNGAAGIVVVTWLG